VGKKGFLKYLDDERTARLRFRISTTSGRVRGVVVQFEIRLGDEWLAVVRYDNAHGIMHRDVLSPDGEEAKSVIELPGLEAFLTFAEQDLLDRWEWYKDRFTAKLRRSRKT